ncbi:thioredoxin family protein [Enterococcus faecalis]
MQPLVVEEAKKNFKQTYVLKINTKTNEINSDDFSELMNQLKIEYLPTLIKFDKGSEVGRIIGEQKIKDLHSFFVK